ncbi:MAG: sodium-dependent transporter [Dehalobacterium sp.]|jgi:NSS family neurotransmitter:Na+ symporter
METLDNRETFSSRFRGFLVIIMTSLGLGNIWRFPYLCAKYGGAAFVVAYIIALILIVSVGNQCEICMGKYSRKAVVGAFTSIGKKKIWRICGWVLLCLNFIVMVYYNVLISWVLRYFATSFSGSVWMAESPQAFYNSFIDTPQVIMWAILVNVIVFGVLWFGMNNGIEKVMSVMGPLLFMIMAIMVVRTLFLPGVEKGLEYYLIPDWSYLTQMETWMQAIGQGLWSGCFGWGIMIAMGSYMKKYDDVGSTITQTTLLDGGISWFVGLAIIPACVVYNVPLDSGTSLAFLVLPEMFQGMPYGHIFMILFFGALMVSGLCASIGCVEAIVKSLIEEWNLTRKQLIPALFVFWNIAALPSCLSKNTYDWIDSTIGTYAILIGGFLIFIFVGYAWGARYVRENILNVGADIKFGRWWDLCVKFIGPLLLIFAGYTFAVSWLLPYIPGYIAWPIILAIVGFNLFVFIEAIRNPINVAEGNVKNPDKTNYFDYNRNQ